MNHIPIRYTPRLVLRPFTFADAPRVQDLIGDKQITAPNANIPRLYAEGAAQRWITAYQSAAAEGRQFNFAVTLAGTKTPGRENDFTDTGHLVGAFRIGQLDDSTDNQAVLGFWMGVPYWNNGFATEAGYSILDFAFAHCRYDRIISCRHNDDPGSGRVLQKLGFVQQPGTRRAEKWGYPIELVEHTLTRDAWSRSRIIRRWKLSPPFQTSPQSSITSAIPPPTPATSNCRS